MDHRLLLQNYLKWAEEGGTVIRFESFWKKIVFSAYWLHSNREMPSKWVKMKFPDLLTNEKDVDNVGNYLNMKFQTKIFTRSRENAKKPHFLA